MQNLMINELINELINERSIECFLFHCYNMFINMFKKWSIQ
jgi:hypothetical protein